MLSVLQAVQLLRRKQKLRAPLRKLLAIADGIDMTSHHKVLEERRKWMCLEMKTFHWLSPVVPALVG